MRVPDHPWSGRLRGKVALVTGSTRGVGKGIALVLGEAGATVYVTGRSVRGKRTTQGLPGTIQDTAEEVTARGGRGVPVQCDHTRDQEIRRLVATIRRRSGRLDVLVNNAFAGEEGRRHTVTYDEFPFWKHDLEEYWYRFITGYLRASLATTLYCLPLMLRRKGGLIVNTLWWNRERYLTDLFFDVGSAGVGRMVYGLGLELQAKGLTAVAVSPGWTRTERMTHYPKEELLSKTQSPEYIGRAIASLALDPKRGSKTGRILEVGALAREYGFRDVDGRFWDYHSAVGAHPPEGWPKDKL
jgi:NAD(P)-dependent dehydrogenase (short-subunit alcohol dehydrogenase family)